MPVDFLYIFAGAVYSQHWCRNTRPIEN